MIKGYRTEATSTASITTSTAQCMLNVPSGKTFILTDLVLAATWGIDTATSPGSASPVALFDTGAASDNVAGTTAQTARLMVNLNVIPANVATAVATVYKQSTVLHFTNGPEFTYGVAPQLIGTGAAANDLGTGALWVSGIIR